MNKDRAMIGAQRRERKRRQGKEKRNDRGCIFWWLVGLLDEVWHRMG